MILIIGSSDSKVKKLGRTLTENHFEVLQRIPSRLPSLTALLISEPSITDMVFLQGDENSWSLGHILAAAKLIQGRGHIFFMSPQNKTLPKMISAVQDESELLECLRKKDAASTDTGGRMQKKENLMHTQPVHKELTLKPLRMPPDRILVIGVTGSQRRIGCTTQAIGIWHYCKEIGLDPAIVASPEKIMEIAAPMKCDQIQDGYLIEGIPFVTNTAQAYDCYILDAGVKPIQEMIDLVDCLILVAGIKPWEIQHTISTVNACRGERMPVLLSFASEEDAAALKPLFRNNRVSVTPWLPRIWTPSEESMMIYDKLLRPEFEQLIQKSEQQEPEEDELKGE